jgi:hypothetical protein
MAKRGKPKSIASSELMWQIFSEYVAYTKSNPIKVKDWVGGQGKQVWRERERPLTMEGFELYVYEKGIAEGVEQYFSNRDGRYEDYVGICSFIRKQIRQDQICGGMAGIYNPSITQRLNGLTETQKTEQSGTLTIVYKDLDANKSK